MKKTKQAMKRKFAILCQIISLIYVSICLIVLFKTQTRSDCRYAKLKKYNTEMPCPSGDRVHSGAIRMFSK